MDFYDETKRHLTNSAPGVWEFTSPHILYLSSEQGEAYTNNKSDKDYRSFHDEAVQIIEENAASIMAEFNGRVTLVDLGPEYPDKTLPLMQQASIEGRPVDYCPVDVNGDYVQIAVDAAQPFAARVTGLQALFNECADKIPDDMAAQRLAFIGLTFMNFESNGILGLLKNISGQNGHLGLACELITDENSVEKIVAHYNNPENENFAYGPLRNLGIPRDDVSYDVRFGKDRVEMGFIVNADQPHLGIKAGDRIISGFSHRYTKEGLEAKMRSQSLQSKIWLSKSGKTAFVLAR